MGRAATQDYANNLSAAGEARLAGASVNPKMVLKFAPAIHSVEAGPFVHNPGAEGLTNGMVEPGQLLNSEAVDLAAGIDAGDDTALIGIDIADTGNELLVEQQRFQAATSFVEQGLKVGQGEFIGQRFRAELANHLIWIANQVDPAKLTHILEAQLMIVIQLENGADVGMDRVRNRLNQQITAHFQMDKQGCP